MSTPAQLFILSIFAELTVLLIIIFAPAFVGFFIRMLIELFIECIELMGPELPAEPFKANHTLKNLKEIWYFDQERGILYSTKLWVVNLIESIVKKIFVVIFAILCFVTIRHLLFTVWLEVPLMVIIWSFKTLRRLWISKREAFWEWLFDYLLWALSFVFWMLVMFWALYHLANAGYLPHYLELYSDRMSIPAIQALVQFFIN